MRKWSRLQQRARVGCAILQVIVDRTMKGLFVPDFVTIFDDAPERATGYSAPKPSLTTRILHGNLEVAYGLLSLH